MWCGACEVEVEVFLDGVITAEADRFVGTQLLGGCLREFILEKCMYF